jgi:hypothetical protein
MFRSLPPMLVLFALTLGAATLIIAQDNETGRPEPAGGLPEGNPAAAGTVSTWEGEVSRRKLDGEDFEILAPAGEEKAGLFFGDTLRTSEGARVAFTLVDGTLIELGPNSELVLERSPEGRTTARLVSGWADVSIGSDEFALVCARHTITGKDSRVQVESKSADSITVFAVEDGAIVRNEFGLVTYLYQGQKMSASYLPDQEVFQVSVHEYNETLLKIEFGDERRLINPGVSFTVDAQGNIKEFERVVVPEKKPVVLELPLRLEEPKDEPFENPGDLKAIHVVSPSKP